MLKRKCSCGRELAVGQAKCSLCAMGLTPSRPLDIQFDFQAGHSVSADSDSGVRCTRCMARLSVAEVGRQTCPYCHASVTAATPERISARPAIQQRREPARQDDRPEREPVKSWPEKAPLR